MILSIILKKKIVIDLILNNLLAMEVYRNLDPLTLHGLALTVLLAISYCLLKFDIFTLHPNFHSLTNLRYGKINIKET